MFILGQNVLNVNEDTIKSVVENWLNAEVFSEQVTLDGFDFEEDGHMILYFSPFDRQEAKKSED